MATCYHAVYVGLMSVAVWPCNVYAMDALNKLVGHITGACVFDFLLFVPYRTDTKYRQILSRSDS